MFKTTGPLFLQAKRPAYRLENKGMLTIF